MQDDTLIDVLHRAYGIKKKNNPPYEHITVDYTPELFNEICEDYGEYFQISWTVCGAQDPAVIYVSDNFTKKHPQFKDLQVVRVIDRFLNSWSSETLLEFSNEDMTEEEYALYDYTMKELEDDGSGHESVNSVATA